MEETLHVIIGGKNSFCNTIYKTLTGDCDNITIFSSDYKKTLFINLKSHPPDAVILEDNLSDTYTLIEELLIV